LVIGNDWAGAAGDFPELMSEGSRSKDVEQLPDADGGNEDIASSFTSGTTPSPDGIRPTPMEETFGPIEISGRM